MDKNGRIQFTIFLIVLIIFLLGAFFLLKKPSIKLTIGKDKYTDGTIESGYVKEVMDRFISEIFFYGDETLLNDTSSAINSQKLSYNLFNEFDSQAKAHFVLESLAIDKVPLKTVQEKYFDYFNEEFKEAKDINLCAQYTLDNNYYIKKDDCHNENSQNILIYKDDYVRKEDKAYLTLYIGQEESGIVYTDYNMQNIYKGEEKMINENNYQFFSKYLVTLNVNEEGLYYFVSLTKV